MKVLFYGHDYVKDLHQKCDWTQPLEVSGKKFTVDYLFRYFPGEDYQSLLNKPDEFAVLANINPDYMVIILGGNSITGSRTNGQINASVTEFYERLNESLPATVKIVAQIEPRYYKEGNPFGAPTAEAYNRRRQIINNHINKKLKKRDLVNHMALLGSPSVYDENAYSDGVHLLDEPLQEYQQVMIKSLVYALECMSEMINY